MKLIQTDIVIVGSGAGGATIAKELAGSGRKIVILEKGSQSGRYQHYNKPRTPHFILNRSYIESGGKKIMNRHVGIVSMRGIGGTTKVSAACFVRSLEKKLQSLEVDVINEFEELEQELHVTPYPVNRLGKGARQLYEAADALGYKWELMPRAVDFNKCQFCGLCTVKCHFDSKWTALDFLDRAKKMGAQLKNVTVDEVLSSNGKAIGVKGRLGLEKVEVSANIVVLAAGAIETAVILQNSGINNAGNKLFCDPYYVIYDSSKNMTYGKEPMSLINKEFVNEQGFMFANSNITRLKKIYRHVSNLKKSKQIAAMLGIMVKIKDDSSGRVNRNGNIEKVLTSGDIEKIEASIPIAEEILVEAGANVKNIKFKSFAGVHPGGTAAIGEVVDKNLETEIKNCYVSDASILPEAPGLPPMLTIMALAKRLAKRLSST